MVEESETEVYCNISTSALAQEAMETLEQETLELMASPAGSVWGGLIKVYAGDTPLLITEEDKEILLRIVEAEATCEDVKGRMLVANVIMNRVVSKGFPNSIAEVVFQNNGVTYQFSPIKDGRYWTVKVSEETREAVERVLAGEDYSQGALFFAARSMANKKAMNWFDSSLKFLFRHGVHEFFTNK
ncbi:MAG: cell wall hydrolase [Lachnospiraceae bacterium]|nr:cell wall hydrolase [Lachnospiraceae bacterium]MBQ8548531.1 cell wall hydrolase [Lachnospiraceae bacterium]MBQ8845601.1 cell wall hydrolase [Lachnospiraceae bacterium]